MRDDLPALGLSCLPHVRVGPDPGGKEARRLVARKGRRTVAEAVVGLPVQGRNRTRAGRGWAVPCSVPPSTSWPGSVRRM